MNCKSLLPLLLCLLVFGCSDFDELDNNNNNNNGDNGDNGGNGDNNNWPKTMERINVSSDGKNYHKPFSPAVSDNGDYVAFYSVGTNADKQGLPNIYILNRKTKAMKPIELNINAGNYRKAPYNSYIAITPDGRFIALETPPAQINGNERSRIYVYNLNTNQSIRIGEDTSPASDGDNRAVAISADGNAVAFMSAASNLVSGDDNNSKDIFLWRRSQPAVERVSLNSAGGEANAGSGAPAMTGDARYVAFTSTATNLVDGDTTGVQDVFVRDRQANVTRRVSNRNSASGTPAISATDGQYIAFSNEDGNVYLFDTRTESPTVISKNTDGGAANGQSIKPAISAGGRYIAFTSSASNLVSNDGNGKRDVFVYDRDGQKIARVSISTQGVEANDDSYFSAISPDGEFIAFISKANNLVEGDDNQEEDLFIAANPLFSSD